MHRSLFARCSLTLGVLLTALMVATAEAAPQQVSDQPGILVTDEELCAFRAPLALTGAGEVPATCAETVGWLQRLTVHDPACAALWVETSAIPDCALPYR